MVVVAEGHGVQIRQIGLVGLGHGTVHQGVGAIALVGLRRRAVAQEVGAQRLELFSGSGAVELGVGVGCHAVNIALGKVGRVPLGHVQGGGDEVVHLHGGDARQNEIIVVAIENRRDGDGALVHEGIALVNGQDALQGVAVIVRQEVGGDGVGDGDVTGQVQGVVNDDLFVDNRFGGKLRLHETAGKLGVVIGGASAGAHIQIGRVGEQAGCRAVGPLQRPLELPQH